MTIELVLICIVVGFAVGAIVYFVLNIIAKKHYSDTIDFDRASKKAKRDLVEKKEAYEKEMKEEV